MVKSSKMLFDKVYIIILIFINLNIVSLRLLKPVDLSWDFDENTVYWINAQPFEFTKFLRPTANETKWYAANEFKAAEHGGTHLDAPYHFYKNGLKVGEIPLENLITNGVVIDISDEVMNSNPLINLQVRHLTEWCAKYGEFKNNTVILVKTGWTKYYPDKKKYFGLSDDNKTLNFPGVDPDAAQWLVNTKRVVGVGLDVASVDEGKATEFASHRILNSHNIYILENVKLIEDLPAQNFTLLVMPMKIKEGTGAPVRVVAIPNACTNL